MLSLSSVVPHRLEQMRIAESSIDEQSLRAESMDDLTIILLQSRSLSEISKRLVF
jgi:hypothetical protein